MFYWTIVFELKHRQRLASCWACIELLQSLRVIISEHDAAVEYCDRPGIHYHGLIEHETDTNVDNDEAVALLKSYCTYFKTEICHSPEQFVKYLAQGKKLLVVVGIAKSLNLCTFFSKIRIAEEVELEHQNQFSKALDFKKIIDTVITKRIFDPEEIFEHITKDYCYASTPDQLKSFVIDSIALVNQKILSESILELCHRFVIHPENYYTVKESAELIEEWCRYQNIDAAGFVLNWVNCLDRQVLNKNSLYFQGSPESGTISIIRSIAEACIFFGEVDRETTGYTYAWEECFEKRCIIMREPIYDERMFDNLQEILKGVGSLVPHRQSILKYLRPTPVIICSSKNDWESDPYFQSIQTSFIESYVNLKPFMKLNYDHRLLHPGWLKKLYEQATENIVSCSEDTLERSMDCEPLVIDISSDSGDEIELNNPINSVSSSVLFFGSPNPRSEDISVRSMDSNCETFADDLPSESRDEINIINSVSSSVPFFGSPRRQAFVGDVSSESRDESELNPPVDYVSSTSPFVGSPRKLSSQDFLVRLMDSECETFADDTSNESRDESELNCFADSVSSTVPSIGSSNPRCRYDS